MLRSGLKPRNSPSAVTHTLVEQPMDRVSVRNYTISELLTSDRFIQRAVGRTDSELRDLISEMCREARLGLVIIHVETSGSKRGSHRVVWQSFTAGPFEDHWFTVPLA